MKISIMIPVYNVVQYIEECIDSVLRQNYLNIEVVVVNDGSTDGSDTIFWKYIEDDRFVFVSQKNQGLSAARNLGIELATGDFIFFLDSDDYLKEGAISEMVTYINPEIDILVSGHITKVESDYKTTYLPSFSNLTGYEATKDVLKCKIPHVAWGKFYRKKIYKKMQFPVGRMCEDLAEVVSAFVHAKNVALLPILSVVYRRRLGSIMHTYKDKIIEDSIFVLEDLMSRVDISEDDIKESYDAKYIKIMMSNINIALRAKDYSAARKTYNLMLSKKCSLKYVSVPYHLAYFIIGKSYFSYVVLNELFINKIKYGFYKIK